MWHKARRTKKHKETLEVGDRYWEKKGEKKETRCHGNVLKMAKQQLITTSTHRYDAYIMAEVTGHLLENLS